MESHQSENIDVVQSIWSVETTSLTDQQRVQLDKITQINEVANQLKQSIDAFKDSASINNEEIWVPNILLVGPPGVGKTMIIKHLWACAEIPLLYLNPTDLISKYLWDHAKNIKNIFNKARENLAIIWFDDFDMINDKESDDNSYMRDIIRELIIQIKGVGYNNKRILVVGTSNKPWNIPRQLRVLFAKRTYCITYFRKN